MPAVPNEQTLINDGLRVKQFMDDDAIGGPNGVLSRLERFYYEEFKRSSTSEERVRAWAKANVLDDFIANVKAVEQAGEIALKERTTRDRAPQK